MDNKVEEAKTHFEKLVKEQLERIERMKAAGDWTDYKSLKPIIIGLVGGDGITSLTSPWLSQAME